MASAARLNAEIGYFSMPCFRFLPSVKLKWDGANDREIKLCQSISVILNHTTLRLSSDYKTKHVLSAS